MAPPATDPDNPYQAAVIRGRVVEMSRDGADEHIDQPEVDRGASE